MRKWWRRFKRWMFGCDHKYLPSFEIRTWYTRARHPRYLGKQFRYECCICDKPTKWMRWSKRAAWEAEHKPDWLNGRLRD